MKKEKTRSPASKGIKIAAFILGAILLALVVFYVVTNNDKATNDDTQLAQTPTSIEMVTE